MPFGAHMSIAGGIASAFARGESVACETMQIFSKNQRQWQAKPYTESDIATYHAEQSRTGIAPVIVHDSYLINLASPDDEVWNRSQAAFRDELERCAQLHIPIIVTHPGAHTGSGEDAGLRREVEALDHLLADGCAPDVMIALETTAGQGSGLGWRFEHLAFLMEHVRSPQRFGICIDTCHIFAAGYDIRTPEAYHATFNEFDRLIGLAHICLFHLNDSAKDLASRVDRHAHIGQGHIGQDAFRLLVQDPRFSHLPMIIETPKGNDMAEDRENLALLRALRAASSG